jgi:aminotransferase
MFLLQNAGIACVPGDAFFHDGYGQHLARFCFAKETAVLQEACNRLVRFPRS